MSDIRERWRTSLIQTITSDWAADHQHVAEMFGRLLWSTDTSAYRDIARLGELPTDTRRSTSCAAPASHQQQGTWASTLHRAHTR